MNNVYKYLRTKKLLCKDSENLSTDNIFRTTARKDSILYTYKSNINNLKTNLLKNYNADKDSILKNMIEKIFNNFIYGNPQPELKDDVNTFCNEIFKLKSSLSSKQNNKSDIKNLINVNKINKEFETIQNPFTPHLISLGLTRTATNIPSNFVNFNEQQLINIQIVSQGKFINMSYPTIGIIEMDAFVKSTLVLKNRSKYTYDLLSFFNILLDNIYNAFEDENNNYFILPLQNLNFGKTITKILTNNNLNKVSSISDYIDTTDICMKDIMTYEEVFKNKKKRYFVIKYIIPYELKNNEIIPMKVQKINKYRKNYNSYLINESDLFNFIYNDLKNRRKDLSKDELNSCYKIMYLFSYRNIQLFYDIYWNFINKKVNKYVMSLKISNNKVYKNLNYNNFIDYIDKINKSLISFKKILLNNLYKIFRPNKIGSEYGIIYDKNKFNDIIIPDVSNEIIFTGKNIFENLPINNNPGTGPIGYSGNPKNLKLFTEFDSKDYYNEDYELFIGVSYDNNQLLDTTLSLFDINNTKFKQYKNFDLKIINIIIKIFKNCVPIELLDNIIKKKLYLRSSRLTDKQKNLLKNFMITEFKRNLKESATYIMSIKNSNKDQHKNILLKSRIHYNISYFIYRTIQIGLYDVDLKNIILDQIDSIKNKYLDIIKEKLK